MTKIITARADLHVVESKANANCVTIGAFDHNLKDHAFITVIEDPSGYDVIYTSYYKGEEMNKFTKRYEFWQSVETYVDIMLAKYR